MGEIKDDAETPRKYHDVENIRLRPSMYLGSTEFFGFIQYLVSAFDVNLRNGATWIEFEINDEAFHISSDARIPFQVHEDGKIEVFGVSEITEAFNPDALFLTALSCRFQATILDGATQTVLVYEFGERDALRQEPCTASAGVHLEFDADFGVFSVTEASPAVVHSYCKRTACLNPGVLIRVKLAGETTEYRSTQGIRDFFDAVTLPYQVLHKPIHLTERDDDLAVETVFVFHSWSENHIWSFANNGRVPDGGTHEAGMLDAIVGLQNLQSSSTVGVLAVLAIEYPRVSFGGCIKSRIGNPELRERVRDLITAGLKEWFRDNEDEVEYLKKIERYQFASIW